MSSSFLLPAPGLPHDTSAATRHVLASASLMLMITMFKHLVQANAPVNAIRDENEDKNSSARAGDAIDHKIGKAKSYGARNHQDDHERTEPV